MQQAAAEQERMREMEEQKLTILKSILSQEAFERRKSIITFSGQYQTDKARKSPQDRGHDHLEHATGEVPGKGVGRYAEGPDRNHHKGRGGGEGGHQEKEENG